MKRLYILAVIVAGFAICEVKEILKECPIWSDQWETIHIPHESNPHKFYKCNYGKKVEFTCPKNAYPPFLLCYNTELQVCDWPWNVTACMGSTEPTTVPTEPTVPTVPTEPTVPTVPTEPTVPTVPTEPTVPTVPTEPTVPTVPTEPTVPTVPTEPTVPTVPTVPTPIPNPWRCPVNGKLPHPTNCKMYYDIDRTPVCCLQNLVFNPKFCVCDLPINVRTCVPKPADYAACGQ